MPRGLPSREVLIFSSARDREDGARIVDSHYTGRLGDALAVGERGSGGPVVGADLAEDVAQVIDDGMLADDEQLGDLAVRLPLGKLPEDLHLAHREAR